MEKITITPLDASGRPKDDGAFVVLFNPASYAVSKTVGWSPAGGESHRNLNAPPLNFDGGHGRTMTLELFYDVTEMVMVGMVPTLLTDVREETGRIVALTRIDEGLGRPPVIEISWGEPGPKTADFPFQGVVTGLNQSFTLFSAEGTPLRATLSVSLTEFLVRDAPRPASDLGAALRVLRAGDRLDALAADHLNDPAQWRSLAQANNIDDPRRLPLGVALTIPGR
jgi:hypothetical protein